MVPFCENTILFLLLFITKHLYAIPVTGDTVIKPPTPPPNLCVLPKELGYSGLSTLIDDCQTLDQYGAKIPKQYVSTYGAQVYICCPEKKNTDQITFPSEYDYSEYEGSELPEYYFEGGEDGKALTLENRCQLEPNSKCTDMNSCSDEDFSRAQPPLYCGTNEKTGIDKVCCKKQQPRTIKSLDKKYGSQRYGCSDMNKICETFVETEPQSCQPDHASYSFMRIVCMKSCNLCGDQGCVDEFEKCEDWSRDGHCVRYPEFMQLHCRESCGVCGFKSPLNEEKQIVKGRDYSDYNSQNFFCGEGKEKQRITKDSRKKRSPQVEEESIDDSELKVFAYSTANSSINCGSTLISDRFFLFAAHCQTQFQNPDPTQNIRSILLRGETKYEENIEIRRIFIHPGFKFPKLYDDIAVGELGRRIIYDYDTYGDSPSCLSKGEDTVGRNAVSQGYGFTEKGKTSDVLLEGNVTIISNEVCNDWLNFNVSSKLLLKKSLERHLDKSITDTLMCSKGIYNETLKAYSGPCEGDSGGPLYINYGSPPESRIQTLEGIVSGGIGCGSNTPSWYTRVFAYKLWINCIISEAKKGLPKEEIEKKCHSVAYQNNPTL